MNCYVIKIESVKRMWIVTRFTEQQSIIYIHATKDRGEYRRRHQGNNQATRLHAKMKFNMSKIFSFFTEAQQQNSSPIIIKHGLHYWANHAMFAPLIVPYTLPWIPKYNKRKMRWIINSGHLFWTKQNYHQTCLPIAWKRQLSIYHITV